MKGEQLELFPCAATPASGPPANVSGMAEILIFPLANRRRKVVDAARALSSRKTEEGKQSYWTRLVRSLRSELRSRGCSDDEVNKQLGAFRSSVGIELSRIEFGDRRSPGGAA